MDPEKEPETEGTPAADIECDACGAQNPADAEKCRNCGEALYEDEPAEDAAASEKDGGLAEWRGLIVVGAIFCVVIAIWMLWTPSPPKPGTVPSTEAAKATDAPAPSMPANEVKEIELVGDAVWVGTSKGVFVLDRKTGAPKQHLDTTSGLTHDFIDAILADSKHRIWVGCFGGGVSVLDGAEWKHYEAMKTNGRTIVYAFEDKSGTLWFGTGGAGALSFDGSKWTTYTSANGLPHDEVNMIVQDKEGALWFGTGGGVARFKDGRWNSYRAADGLANDKVMAILFDKDGGKWFGTWGGGITRFDGTKFSQVPAGPAEGPISSFILSGRTDAQGRHWFGTHDGVSMWDGKAWRHFTSADGLLGSDVYTLEIDTDGYIWFGTYKGVSRLSPDLKEWKTFTNQ